MNDDRKTYLIVGKIGSSYGIKGWLKIFSLSDEPEALIEYKNWYIKTKNGWEVLKTDARKQYGNHLIAHIVGIDDIDTAKQLTNKQIAILTSELPETDKHEFYWKDLEGLTVITKKGEKLGQIDHMMETGSNDVMVVSGDKRRLIPFVLNKIVLSVDLEKREMIVDWDPNY